jgi:hypothetical protein
MVAGAQVESVGLTTDLDNDGISKQDLEVLLSLPGIIKMLNSARKFGEAAENLFDDNNNPTLPTSLLPKRRS